MATKVKTVELKQRRGYMPPCCVNPDGTTVYEVWKRSLPFNVNPRGILVHRVKNGVTYFARNGMPRHACVTFWCGAQVIGNAGISLTADPPDKRLVCTRCETLAVLDGQPTSDELVGRHVHVGSLRAVRECCSAHNN